MTIRKKQRRFTPAFKKCSGTAVVLVIEQDHSITRVTWAANTSENNPYHRSTNPDISQTKRERPVQLVRIQWVESNINKVLAATEYTRCTRGRFAVSLVKRRRLETEFSDGNITSDDEGAAAPTP